jgi:hypothetical protein
MSGMIDTSGQVIAVWRAPFADGMAHKVPFTAGGTIADMIAAMDFLPPDFHQRGSVLLGGHKVSRRNWNRIRPKPGVKATFHYALGGGGEGGGGKKGKSGILGLVIAIAAIAASVFTLGGGFAFLGTAFAQGAIGAKLLAGAFSLAGSLASAALSAPPTQQKAKSQDRPAGPASASGNVLGPGVPIPRVVGTAKIFPPLGSQPFTYRVGQDEFVEAIFCLAGPHDLQNIRVGDTLISDTSDITVQIRNGWADDTAIDLVNRYAVTKQPGIELSAHDVQPDAQDTLTNQTRPDLSVPHFHSVGAAASPDSILVDLLLSEGLYDNTDPNRRLTLPLRVTMKDTATGIVYNLPEFQFSSKQSREIKLGLQIVWRDQTVPIPTVMPAKEGWTGVFTSVPAQALPSMGGWTADASFYTGSGPTFLKSGNEGTSGVKRCYADGASMVVEIDAAAIPKSRYQLSIIRGAAFDFADFSQSSAYTYSGIVQDFFGYILSSGTAQVIESRENLSDRIGLVRVSSVYDSHPVAGGAEGCGLALITIVAKNRQVEDLSVIASGYVKDWDGTGWNTVTTTSNPVPHYFDVLRGPFTPDALDLDLIDNDSLVDWRQACIDNSYTCDMICEGDAIADVLSRIAGCGYARPRASETWGVIRDFDRSAEDPVQVFTARNSAGISMTKAFARLPDAFRAVYTDADGAQQQELVYRPGYENTVNPRIEEVQYVGLKTAAMVRQRALFDLMQGDLRSAFWSFSAPMEALACARGDLIQVNHDVIDQTHASARILEVEISGGNVIAIDVDSELPVYNEPLWQDIVAVEAVTTFELIGAKSSIGIRQSDSLQTIHAATGTTGSRTRIAFATPVPVVNDDDGLPLIREDNLVWIGIGTTNISMRLIAFGIEYDANQMAKITAVDEAPELWAA